ncbi:hypothetical protein [Pseudorhodoferax sp.]|uniref:hypothetical protein n=1 Tax=Pseudorhodoferax sp. TaxID=1993553 RepID=UPI0039E629B3
MSPQALRRLFGTEEAVAPALALHAGPLAARLQGTRLGPILCEGHEVWHGVDLLHRDPHWGTPAAHVQQVEHLQSGAGFEACVRGHAGPGAQIAFEIRIAGSARSLRYTATATVREDLWTSRTGIVLMHPLAACGRLVEVEHTDGRRSASTFPTLIAPWPPFTLVRALRHEFADDAWAVARLTGDDFELEDQRNNADASFKTYSRSNLMPRPYLLRAGTVLRQCADLSIESVPRPAHGRRAGPVHVGIGAAEGELPAIGTAVSAADLHAPPEVHAALRTLAPAHLHLSLQSGDAVDGPGIARLLDAAGCALHLEIDTPAGGDAAAALQRIAAALRAAAVVPRAVAVFPSTAPVIAAARRAFPASRIGGGTPLFFTQLNRIEDLGTCDFLCFGTASVVHGSSDDEIMAGLQSLPAMVATLRQRHGQVPVHVGPSGIGARRSPFGGQPDSDGGRRTALARRDPRTRGQYGAAWALGYLAQFVCSGAQAITLFDLAGDAALVAPDGPVPAFEVMRRLGRPASWRRARVFEPEAVAALALEADGRREVLVANLQGTAVAVQIDDAGAGRRIDLGPYDVAVFQAGG